MTTVANTITPDSGNSTQGQQFQQYSDALAKISGMTPAAQAYTAAGAAGPNYSGTDIPQQMSNEDKLQTMFANDQTLAQKYTSSIYGAPAGNPAGFASSPLQQTADNVNTPQNLTPQGTTANMNQDLSGQNDLMNNVLKAIDFSGTKSMDAYNSMMGALSTLMTNEEKQQELAQSANQVVQGSDGFYLVNTNTGISKKLVSKPGKWAVTNTPLLGIKGVPGETANMGTTTYTYTPPDGSTPSVFNANETVQLVDPSVNPPKPVNAKVGSGGFNTLTKEGWILYQ